MNDENLERVVREEWGRLVALLLARYRRLDLVEDALGDAIEAATRTWRVRGVPDDPVAWLLTTAGRRVLDRLRSEAVHLRRAPELIIDAEHGPTRAGTIADPGGIVEDDVLRLVLMCTHPALAPEAAAALALRLVLGVSTRDIARLFLVPETTMAARITRAKKKIVDAADPLRDPRSRGAARPPRHRRPDRVPRLHRRVRPRQRRGADAHGPGRRSGAPGAGDARAAARR